MKVVASIQVRMGSSRLPGKVMMPVLDKPIVGHLIDRLQRCRTLDEVIVATSVDPANDVIEAYCDSRNVPCFRGSEDDVLDRTLKALQWRDATIGVEVFGDCPLIDPVIVDDIVSIFLHADPPYDFVGNDLKTTYPPGMDVEVFSVAALKQSSESIDDMAIREHGTLHIRQNPDTFRITNIEAPPELTRPDLEIEIDTREDFEVIKTIIEHFKGRSDVSARELIDFMDEHPEVAEKNRHIERRWKEFRDE